MQATIETAEVLVAFKCEHSHMLTAEELTGLKADPVLASLTFSRAGCLEGTTLRDVLTQTDPQYIQLPDACEAASCQNIDPASWSLRLRDAFQQVEQTVKGIIVGYVELGYEYHNVVPAVRAKTANETICELTHLQFGIERRGVDRDPFFAPLQKIVNLLMRTTVLSNPGMIKPPVVKVLLQTLNSTRANAAVLSALVDDLSTGVQRLQDLELNGDFVEQKGLLPSTTHGGQMKKLNKSILPTMLFERAVRRRWRLRIGRLLQFSDHKPQIHTRRNTRWNP